MHSLRREERDNPPCTVTPASRVSQESNDSNTQRTESRNRPGSTGKLGFLTLLRLHSSHRRRGHGGQVPAQDSRATRRERPRSAPKRQRPRQSCTKAGRRRATAPDKAPPPRALAGTGWPQTPHTHEKDWKQNTTLTSHLREILQQANTNLRCQKPGQCCWGDDDQDWQVAWKNFLAQFFIQIYQN